MSSSKGNQERYEDILKRIAERKPFGSKRPPIQAKTPQERALDRINAYDCLAEIARREYAGWMVYGPKSLRGAAWAGVMVWAHRKGYHGYQTLTLHGAWAHYASRRILLSIASRQLAYSAPIFDAGVFRVAIANNFRIYYADKGAPPEESEAVLYRCDFQDGDRLKHREALEAIVKQWRSDFGEG